MTKEKTLGGVSIFVHIVTFILVLTAIQIIIKVIARDNYFLKDTIIIYKFFRMCRNIY